VLPIILPRLIGRYGLPNTLRICAIVLAVALVPVLPLIKGRIPPSKIKRPSTKNRAIKGLLNRAFLLMLCVNTIQGFAYFVPVIWLPSKWHAISLITKLMETAFASSLHVSASGGGLPISFLNGKMV
jgi:hypothetical protein